METDTLQSQDAKPIGGCYLGDEIGSGPRGVLYRGYQPERDREVAVCRLNPASPNVSTGAFDRSVIGTLKHANIVSTYACTYVDMQAYLITKFIDGYSVEQLLDGNCDYKGNVLLSKIRGESRRFARFAAELASGLQHAHEKGILHGHLKPSNLMLDRRGHPWITDFGWAEKKTDTDALSWYDAPERKTGRLDVRSDIYSLGVTLFQIASGGMPTTGGSSSAGQFCELSKRHPEIPAPLARLIEKACAKSPEDRYQTASEMHVVFDRYLSGQEADRRKGNRLPDHVFRRRRRRRRLMTAVGATLVLCGLVSMLYQKRVAQPATVGTSTVSGHLPEGNSEGQRDAQTQDDSTR